VAGQGILCATSKSAAVTMATADSTTRQYRVGVDVGGTNTDAVIVDTSQADGPNCVAASYKAPTSSDVTSGIEEAVRSVLETSGLNQSQISSITIGTTHFINALIERDVRHISKVAVLRLSKSFTREVPPFSDFPDDLRHIIECYNAFIDGGLNIDGSPESEVREDQVDEFCAEVTRRRIPAVAIVGVFSPLDTMLQQEHVVQKWIETKCPGVVAVTSASISNIGLLERENATIVNTAILAFARRTIGQFQRAIKGLGLRCPLYLTQNDGTLLDASTAARAPIRTFNSGPTNSMRGAAYLSGIGRQSVRGASPVLVCDIGGTTSDVGMLLPSGYPRKTLLGSTVAGVNFNYAMPQVESLGIGGGSVVRYENAATKVGVDSVGRHIRQEARIFGGQTLTATDIAVLSGKGEIQGADVALLHGIDDELVSGCNAFIKHSLERIVDSMKTSPGNLDLILVGGGSIIAPDQLKGVSKIIRPAHFEVANAVGAATACLSVTVDMIVLIQNQTIEDAVESTRQEALRRLHDAGSLKGTEEVTEVDILPLQYVDKQVRVILKIVGDYDPNAVLVHSEEIISQTDDMNGVVSLPESPQHRLDMGSAESAFDIRTYKPDVAKNLETGRWEWSVSSVDLDFMADGCYVLGCGGGGDPRPEMLKLKRQIAEGYRLRCITPESLKDDARIYCEYARSAGAQLIEV
jgi:N-methylhydantoinase A/oxoprolinase/acetone carboxylase beta subunit